jgi:hypothetical protein
MDFSRGSMALELPWILRRASERGQANLAKIPHS